MSHEALCERAKRWLRGTWKCNPVFANIASCSEIPDAIGWTSCGHFKGSTVVECKTSVSDFYADKHKRFVWRSDKNPYFHYPSKRLSTKEAAEMGYQRHEIEMMGDFRYYFCDPGIITEEMVETHAPDHGLLYRKGNRVVVVRHGKRRELVDKDGEIRYLRFAILNSKEPFTEDDLCDETIVATEFQP